MTTNRALSLLLGLSLAIPFGVPPARGQTALPDLIVDGTRLANSVGLRRKPFKSSDCAVIEGCVRGTGKRSLVTFDTATPNIGVADLFLGNPANNPSLFEFSSCHQHYHFSGYALYELLTEDGNLVVTGRKQAFCLLDWSPYLSTAGPSNGYNCSYQGITAGWQDVYTRSLDCQWLDVTGVAPGNYLLRVSVNPDHRLAESSYENNAAVVRVTLPRHWR